MGVIPRSGGQISFQGTQLVGADGSSTEPTDPDVLTTAQQNAAVSLSFVDTAEFEARFESLPGTAPGKLADDLYFSGKSQLSSLNCQTTLTTTRFIEEQRRCKSRCATDSNSCPRSAHGRTASDVLSAVVLKARGKESAR